MLYGMSVTHTSRPRRPVRGRSIASNSRKNLRSLSAEDHKLMRETRAAKILRGLLVELTNDPEALADTIEGETNLRDSIHGVLREIGEDEILIDGIAVAIQALQQRKERCEYRIEKRREAILLAMEAGEVPKITYPEATLSVGLAGNKLIVTDETKIPDIFFEEQPKKLNKAMLRAALDIQRIEGASLSNGGKRLILRRL